MRLERAVDLDGVYERDTPGQEARQDTEARPDLEHHVAGSETGHALDDAQDVLVHEEMLAERFPGANAHRPKQRAAFSSICTASSSASPFRARASAATV